ncbi:unnamed protein product [Discosporangium mesarthrocarpum]
MQVVHKDLNLKMLRVNDLAYLSSTGLGLKSEDHSLLLSLDGCMDNSIWELLPYAYAASFGSDWWKRCTYVSRLDGYVHNEHVIVATITDLMSASCARRGGVEKGLMEYVKASSFVLLRMKMQRHSNSAYKEYKYFCMYAFLDKFVEQCPSLDRNSLEGLIPYALMHAGYLDMSRSSSRGGSGLAGDGVYDSWMGW